MMRMGNRNQPWTHVQNTQTVPDAVRCKDTFTMLLYMVQIFSVHLIYEVRFIAQRFIILGSGHEPDPDIY